MRTNMRKVIRDLEKYKGRTALALLAVMIGVMSVGFVLSAYAILKREMQTNFLTTNPASVVIHVRDLDSDRAALLRSAYPDADITLRKTVPARLQRSNGTFGTMYLFAVESFAEQTVDTFELEEGVFPENADQMVLERDSLKILPQLSKGCGEFLTVQIPGQEPHLMELSGRVHAPGLSPASMEKYSYAFLSLDALSALGDTGWYDEIRIVSYENRLDRVAMRALAEEIEATLTQSGCEVIRTDVPEPGKHPHADQLDSLLFLLQAFSVISVLAAGIVMINLMQFILSSQIRQIAIMKSLGASAADIVLPYVSYILMIGAAAVLAAIPAAVMVGRAYASFAAGILNFDILNDAIPPWVFAVQAGAGLLIPLLASVPGILKSLRITVKEGLSDSPPTGRRVRVAGKITGAGKIPGTGKTQGSGKMQGTGRKAAAQRFRISSLLLMPLKNLSRNLKRTVPAVLALATGGILFMTSQNIVSSVNATVDGSMDTFRYQYDLRLAGREDPEKIEQTLRRIPEINDIEFYGTSQMFFSKSDETGSSVYPVRTISTESRLVDFSRIMSGTAAERSALERTDAVYINTALHDEEPWLTVGMTVTMNVNGSSGKVYIAGIVSEVPPLPCAYMAPEDYEALYGTPARQNVFLSTGVLTAEEQSQVAADIEAACASNGITVSENWNISLLRKAFVEHLNVIINFLAVVSVLAVIVGGLSIASIVGMNISERRRELGTLRAVGSNPHQTMGLVSGEVLLTGLAGWLTGLAVSIPVSVWAGNYFGRIFLHSDLTFAFSVSGAMIWLGLSLAVSLLSGLVPAANAARSPLKEMLAYE